MSFAKSRSDLCDPTEPTLCLKSPDVLSSLSSLGPAVLVGDCQAYGGVISSIEATEIATYSHQ